VKIEHAVNKVLERAFGCDSMGNPRVWLDTQNLNSKPWNPSSLKDVKLPIDGRCWLHISGSPHRVLSWQWCLLSKRCGVELELVQSEDLGPQGYIAFPPFAFYWGAHGFLPLQWVKKLSGGDADRTIFSLRVFDWAVWWECWHNPNVWSSDDPMWSRCSFHPFRSLRGLLRGIRGEP
jgi:hypothetical protein